jgi:hypothetical protein
MPDFYGPKTVVFGYRCYILFYGSLWSLSGCYQITLSEFAAEWTGFEKEVLMPILIPWIDKMQEQQIQIHERGTSL